MQLKGAQGEPSSLNVVGSILQNALLSTINVTQ